MKNTHSDAAFQWASNSDILHITIICKELLVCSGFLHDLICYHLFYYIEMFTLWSFCGVLPIQHSVYYVPETVTGSKKNIYCKLGTGPKCHLKRFPGNNTISSSSGEDIRIVPNSLILACFSMMST